MPFDRLGEVPDARVGCGQRVEQIGVLTRRQVTGFKGELDGAAAVAYRRIFRSRQQPREVVVGPRVLRVELNRFIEISDRSIILLERAEGGTAVAIRLGVFRVELNSPVEVRNRSLILLDCAVSSAAVVIRNQET